MTRSTRVGSDDGRCMCDVFHSHHQEGPLQQHVDSWDVGQGDVKAVPPYVELGGPRLGRLAQHLVLRRGRGGTIRCLFISSWTSNSLGRIHLIANVTLQVARKEQLGRAGPRPMQHGWPGMGTA